MDFIVNYLILGLIYAGFTFNDTAELLEKNEDVKKLWNKKTEDLTGKELTALILVVVLVILIGFIKMVIYPYLIALSIAKRIRKKKVEETNEPR